MRELLRKVLLYLGGSGQRCLQTILCLWHRLTQEAFRRCCLSNEHADSSKEPESVLRSTDIILTSRLPDSSYPGSSLTHGRSSAQGPSSTHGSLSIHSPLALDTRRQPMSPTQEPSTAQSLDSRGILRSQSTPQAFSPSGTTFVSSPTALSPQTSISPPNNRVDDPDSTVLVPSSITNSLKASIPLPYSSANNPDSDVPKLKATTPNRSRRYKTRLS